MLKEGLLLQMLWCTPVTRVLKRYQPYSEQLKNVLSFEILEDAVEILEYAVSLSFKFSPGKDSLLRWC